MSHETIYLSLFVQARGALRRELTRHLRTGRAMRFPRGARARAGQGRGQLVDTVSIRERPPEVEDRAVPGHWEGDLVYGRRPSAVGTLVERTSRYVQLFPLPAGYKGGPTREALAAAIRRLPGQLRRSLTWDHGKEMSDHVRFTVDTGARVYFCDPRRRPSRPPRDPESRPRRRACPPGASFRRAPFPGLNGSLHHRPRREHTGRWR